MFVESPCRTHAHVAATVVLFCCFIFLRRAQRNCWFNRCFVHLIVFKKGFVLIAYKLETHLISVFVFFFSNFAPLPTHIIFPREWIDCSLTALRHEHLLYYHFPTKKWKGIWNFGRIFDVKLTSLHKAFTDSFFFFFFHLCVALLNFGTYFAAISCKTRFIFVIASVIMLQ